MRIIVVGSKTFKDYKMLEENLDNIINGTNAVEIVTGDYKGADVLAAKYANKRHYKITTFPTVQKRYKKSDGYIRSEEMHKYISMEENRKCVVFWDGISEETMHSFELSKKYKTPLSVIMF